MTFYLLCFLATFLGTTFSSVVLVQKNIKITKFHVNSKIQMRYAITEVEAEVKNDHYEKREIFFDMDIPKDAFVSNFSMIIQNQTYVAKVETKQKAKKIYRESKNNAGLLESKVEFEETHHVSGKQATTNTSYPFLQLPVF